MADPISQRQLLAMSTAAAILCRIGRIDGNVTPASFFRFAGQLVEELRPGRILNALAKAWLRVMRGIETSYAWVHYRTN